MCFIRLGLGEGFLIRQLTIPILNPGLLRSHEIVVHHRLTSFPNSGRTTKVGDSTVGGHARPGKNHDAGCIS